jgi:GGDEF domain-containing protein
VAKAWLLTLVADAPLAQAGNVPAAELARGGPALCSGILVALGSDRELERLVAGVDGRAPLAGSVVRLTGARTPAALTAAVESLRAATWHALRRELHDAYPDVVADLADRLAYVCARVVETALAAPAPESPSRGEGPLAEALATPGPAPAPAPPRSSEGIRAYAPTPATSVRPLAPEEEGGRTFRFSGGAPAPAPAHVPEADEPLAPPPAGVEVVDLPRVAPEVAEPAEDDPLSTLAEELAVNGASTASADEMYALPADAPSVTRLRRVDTTWEATRDAGPPWLAAISRRLERREQDGLPFAVFVVEVDDLDRLLAAQTGREVALALETAERNLTAQLAPADLIVRERLGRWWLTSPDRDPAAARDLGTRVASAIGAAELGGAPLSASIGVAVCPDDGDTLDTLASRADEGMFAARAAGVPLA